MKEANPRKKLKAALVVQRYGLDVGGGSEALCRMIAEKMGGFWKIKILTSCAREYTRRFENDFPPGIEEINGVLVHRFSIDYFRSEDAVFSKLDSRVLKKNAFKDEIFLWLKEIGPYCSELLNYIETNRDNYDFFLFFTYLYSTTTLGLPLVRDKAILIPTAHDEPPIHAEFFDTFFSLPKALILSTEEELNFLKKRVPVNLSATYLKTAGIELSKNVSKNIFKKKYNLSESYLLYVGRIQIEKGCDELFAFYQKLPSQFQAKYPMVLLGKVGMQVPEIPYILNLGFVDEEVKLSSMKGAKLLIMPSRYESLSLVIMEAWLSGIPVLVNGKSKVLKDHCKKSNGGLWYENYEEFEYCLHFLLDKKNESIKNQMAINGLNYVNKNYGWSTIQTHLNKIVCKELNIAQN